MALSPAKRKSNDRYLQAHYAKLTVAYPREYVETVKQAAKGKGETLAGFVKRAIDERLAEDPEGQPGQEEGKDAR